MKMENERPSSGPSEEIDLVLLVKQIWVGRRTVLKTLILFLVIGIFVALFSQKEFTTSTIIVPQIGSDRSGLNSLSSLAGLAGYNFDGTGSAVGRPISPLVYPQIMGSVPLQLELMNSSFTISGLDHQVTLFEYFTKIHKPGIPGLIIKYTIGLPGIIIGAIKGKNKENGQESNLSVILLTPDQESIRKLLDNAIELIVNSKEGYLRLIVKMPEAILSAQVAQRAQELLQKYITEFKIAKAANQLNFIEGRFAEKKLDFEKAQINLARFRDRNKSLTNAVARTEEERLQSEYNIAYSIYAEMASQLEKAKIQVKEDTPVLAIVKPAVVPIERSKPKKVKILIIWLFFGVIAGTCIVFGRNYLEEIRTHWKESE